MTNNENNIRYRQRLKIACIERYGTKCTCCGETQLEFLSVDHINGGGNKHREEIKTPSGWHFYLWLKKNNYPEGYRILCHNCNMAHAMLGYCPHKHKPKD